MNKHDFITYSISQHFFLSVIYLFSMHKDTVPALTNKKVRANKKKPVVPASTEPKQGLMKTESGLICSIRLVLA